MFKIGVIALPPVRALLPIFTEKNKAKFLKNCIFQIRYFKTHQGIVLGFLASFYCIWCCFVVLAIEFVLLCMQIVILGLYTVVAHLLLFPVIPIAKKLKLMSFELEEGEIPPYSELAHGLEQVLGRIQKLEAAVHSECQSQLAAEAANQ